MIRTFKNLGITIIAVLALGAVGATAASAAEFTAASYPASLHGEDTGNHKFETAEGLSVQCTSATFTGTLSEASETQTITPTYAGCSSKVSIFTFPATVNMNSCDYLFNANGEVDLNCPSGALTITVYQSAAKHSANEPLCTLSVAGQPGLESVSYTNQEGGTIKVDAEVGGIEYTRTGSALCGPATGESEYTGPTVISGEDAEGNPVAGDVQ